MRRSPAIPQALWSCYANDRLTREVFSGRGLALTTGEAAPALPSLPAGACRSGLEMMATYAGRRRAPGVGSLSNEELATVL